MNFNKCIYLPPWVPSTNKKHEFLWDDWIQEFQNLALFFAISNDN